jgi:hypothetical protein
VEYVVVDSVEEDPTVMSARVWLRLSIEGSLRLLLLEDMAGGLLRVREEAEDEVMEAEADAFFDRAKWGGVENTEGTHSSVRCVISVSSSLMSEKTEEGESESAS